MPTFKAGAVLTESLHMVQLDSTGTWRVRNDHGDVVGWFACRVDAAEALTAAGYDFRLGNAIGSTWAAQSDPGNWEFLDGYGEPATEPTCEHSDDLNGECGEPATRLLTFDPDVWTDPTPIALCARHAGSHAYAWRHSTAVHWIPLVDPAA